MDDTKKQLITYRAMLGWQGGMLIGMLGAAVVSIIYLQNVWLKVFSGIGLLSASLATIYGFITTWKQYKMFIQLTKDIKPEEVKQEETK